MGSAEDKPIDKKDIPEWIKEWIKELARRDAKDGNGRGARQATDKRC